MTATVLQPETSPNDLLYSIGILTFPGFLNPTEIETLRNACEHVRDRFYEFAEEEKPTMRDTSCLRQVEEPIWHRGDDQKHRLTLLEFAADARFVGAVEQCFQGPSMYGSSSLFVNPRFSCNEGQWHRDSQFIFHGDEEKVKEHVRDEVIAVQFQIALVDNEDIEYVPYSPTRYDSPEEYRVRVADGGINSRDEMPYSVRVRQRAGDAVLFNPNGMHRGRYRSDKPRLTLMYTYTPRSKSQFNEFTYQPWFAQPGFLDGLSKRARAYYEEHIDVYRDFWASEVRPSAFR